ncbi:MAG: cytochrome C biogenesis protein CcmF, partial [Acidobacteria bacterium]
MTAGLGRFLILASVFVSAAGSMIAFSAGRKNAADGLRVAQRFAYGFAVLMALATLVMEYALLSHDFSVGYVAHVGSREVPTWVTIVSLWSSLEGSILFWGLVLGAYIAGATWLTRDRYPEYMPYA